MRNATSVWESRWEVTEKGPRFQSHCWRLSLNWRKNLFLGGWKEDVFLVPTPRESSVTTGNCPIATAKHTCCHQRCNARFPFAAQLTLWSFWCSLALMIYRSTFWHSVLSLLLTKVKHSPWRSRAMRHSHLQDTRLCRLSVCKLKTR